MARRQVAEKVQKITVFIPSELLHSARNVANENITETVKSGLRLLIAAQAAQNLRKMRGKVKFSIDVQKLREDE